MPTDLPLPTVGGLGRPGFEPGNQAAHDPDLGSRGNDGDPTPGGPVESREQPVVDVLVDHYRYLDDLGLTWGCACGWQGTLWPQHVAPFILAAAGDATTERLEAMRASRDDWERRSHIAAALSRTTAAERDRARDLAAGAVAALEAIRRNCDAMESNVRENQTSAYWAGVEAALGSTRKFIAAAAGLEAELAERDESNG